MLLFMWQILGSVNHVTRQKTTVRLAALLLTALLANLMHTSRVILA